MSAEYWSLDFGVQIMCLGVVGRIVELKADNRAIVEIMGVEREISVILVPDIKLGEYVMIHAGFAINPIDEEAALETEEILKQVFGEP